MFSNEKPRLFLHVDDVAYFKADLCCYSPESYTLEEKR